MFDSREHAAEYLLVLALPYIYNLVISTYSTGTVPVPVQYSKGMQYSTGAVRGKICSAVFRPKFVCNTPLGLSNANTLADTPKSKMLPLIIIFYSLYSTVQVQYVQCTIRTCADLCTRVQARASREGLQCL